MSRLLTPKRLTLLALAFLAFLQGAVGQYLQPGALHPRSDIGVALAGAMLLFFWYRLDTDERAFQRSIWLNVGVVALALFALPYYFFRSRGFLKGFVACLLFLLCGVVWAVLALAGEYATYYGLQS